MVNLWCRRSDAFKGMFFRLGKPVKAQNMLSAFSYKICNTDEFTGPFTDLQKIILIVYHIFIHLAQPLPFPFKIRILGTEGLVIFRYVFAPGGFYFFRIDGSCCVGNLALYIDPSFKL